MLNMIKDYMAEMASLGDTTYSSSCNDIKIGNVVEMFIGKLSMPIVLVVVNIKGKMADLALMSYLWEIGTEYDLIVPFKHVLRDTWIIETDLIYSSFIEYVKSNFNVIGNIDIKYINIINDFIDGKINSLPSEIKGAGSFLKPKKQFKEFEKARSKFLVNEFFK